MKMRQDAWTPEDDLLLAETVLRHIREGSTQLKAFDEVGDKLNRTAAACGFRWNAEVRQNYEEAVQIAKKQRKELKRAQADIQRQQLSAFVQQQPAKVVIDAEFSEEIAPSAPAQALSLDSVIQYLQQLKESAADNSELQTKNEQLRREYDELKKQHELLQQKFEQLTKQQEIIQEDYQTLVRIMDRARKMVLFDEPQERMAPIFKMDQNGNLDIISK
ncbi:MAG: RsfA family transcriptional regulator [Ectobacillus sp.]